MVTPAYNWKPGTATLTYGIGGRSLLIRRYRALVCTTWYTHLPNDLKGLSIPFDDWPADVEALKIPSCPLTSTFPPLHIHQQAICYVTNLYRRFTVDVGKGGFTDYLATNFSSKSRSTLRRKLRQFETHCGGAMDFRSYAKPKEMVDFLKLASIVSAKSYQERLLGKGLPTSAEFADDVSKRAENASVRGFVLFAGPAPVAYMYCPIEHDSMLYEHVGFDPDYRDFSVGTILLYLALERMFTEKIVNVFDFTEGEGEHKDFWATAHLNCGDLLLLPQSFGSRLTVNMHRGYRTIYSGSVQILSTWGGKQFLKKWWRKAA